mgnify:CR=1 FL=1
MFDANPTNDFREHTPNLNLSNGRGCKLQLKAMRPPRRRVANDINCTSPQLAVAVRSTDCTMHHAAFLFQELELGDFQEDCYKCEHCQRWSDSVKLMCCRACNHLWYCSRESQKSAWKCGHKADCAFLAMPLTFDERPMTPSAFRAIVDRYKSGGDFILIVLKDQNPSVFLYDETSNRFYEGFSDINLPVGYSQLCDKVFLDDLNLEVQFGKPARGKDEVAIKFKNETPVGKLKVILHAEQIKSSYDSLMDLANQL